MRLLCDSDFLNLWESGQRRHPLDRALLTLGTAFAGSAGGDPADWPLGRRNQALARIHCACFGTAVRGWVACRQCGEKLEFELDGRKFEEAGAGEISEPVVVGGSAFRLPTSRDLAHAAEGDPRSAATRLVESCRLERADAPALSEEDLEELGLKMALADPMAEYRLGLDCPDCGAKWEETLDLAAFVWAEIEARVRRLLHDVHTLASAYGWSESSLLSMSPGRRNLYLELLQS